MKRRRRSASVSSRMNGCRAFVADEPADERVVLRVRRIAVEMPKELVEPMLRLLQRSWDVVAEPAQLRRPNRDEQRLHRLHAAVEVRQALTDELFAGKTGHALTVAQAARRRLRDLDVPRGGAGVHPADGFLDHTRAQL